MSTERETVEIDRSPTRTSALIAMVAAVVAAATSGPFSLLALPFSFGGVAMFAYGLFVSETRQWVSIGTAGIFVGLLVSGAYGTAAELTLLSLIATIVAWDVGENAINLGEQIGRQSRTTRSETVHAAVSVLAGVLFAGFGYLVYTLSAGGQPAAALVALLGGAVVLLWAMRS